MKVGGRVNNSNCITVVLPDPRYMVVPCVLSSDTCNNITLISPLHVVTMIVGLLLAQRQVIQGQEINKQAISSLA